MVIHKNKENKEELLLWWTPATMGPERSSSTSKAPLHNFTLPGGLRWGNQKFLRCMKVNSNGQISAMERKPSSAYTSSQSTDNRGANAAGDNGSHPGEAYNKLLMRRGGGIGGSDNDDDCASYYSNYNNGKKREVGAEFKPPLPLPPEKRLRVVEGSGGGGGEDGVGIAAVREKVILDLQSAADKMKDAIFRRESFDGGSDEVPSGLPVVGSGSMTTPAVEEGVQPWSLRTRRATYRLVNGGVSGGAAVGGGGGLKNLTLDVIRPNVDALMTSPKRVAGEATPRLRSGAAVASPSREKKERAKFSVSLARREIEEDFMAMVRHRPPRRAKKRAKYIQKQLDTLFPGLWLTEITADIYKVPETQ